MCALVTGVQTCALPIFFDRHDMLIEAPLPPPNWPRWIRMSPSMWGFFARLWWWFFNHHEGQETRSQDEKIGRASCRERGVSARVDLGGRRNITQKKV